TVSLTFKQARHGVVSRNNLDCPDCDPSLWRKSPKLCRSHFHFGKSKSAHELLFKTCGKCFTVTGQNFTPGAGYFGCGDLASDNRREIVTGEQCVQPTSNIFATNQRAKSIFLRSLNTFCFLSKASPFAFSLV